MNNNDNHGKDNNRDQDRYKGIAEGLEKIWSVMVLVYELQLAQLTDKEGDKLLNKLEVKARLNISPRTYYRYKSQKILVPIKIGSSDYYYESDMPNIVEQINKRGGY